MLTSTDMRSPREIRIFFGPLLAFLFLAIPVEANGTFHSSVPNLGHEDQIFSRPLTELTIRMHDPVIAADLSAAPAQVAEGHYLPEPAAAILQPEVAPNSNEVVRDRGFGKALLIILLAGGLVRLLTSPAYQKFISDALDPKAF